jgi:hypothetical protein
MITVGDAVKILHADSRLKNVSKIITLPVQHMFVQCFNKVVDIFFILFVKVDILLDCVTDTEVKAYE